MRDRRSMSAPSTTGDGRRRGSAAASSARSILVFAYFVGVALVGAGLGALVVHLVWSRLGQRSAVRSS